MIWPAHTYIHTHTIHTARSMHTSCYQTHSAHTNARTHIQCSVMYASWYVQEGLSQLVRARTAHATHTVHSTRSAHALCCMRTGPERCALRSARREAWHADGATVRRRVRQCTAVHQRAGRQSHLSTRVIFRASAALSSSGSRPEDVGDLSGLAPPRSPAAGLSLMGESHAESSSSSSHSTCASRWSTCVSRLAARARGAPASTWSVCCAASAPR